MDLGGCLSKKMPVEKDKAVKYGTDVLLNHLGHGETRRHGGSDHVRTYSYAV